jgi:hypothetical protein
MKSLLIVWAVLAVPVFTVLLACCVVGGRKEEARA